MWLVRPLGFSLDDYYLRRAGLDYWDELEWEAVDSWQHLIDRMGVRPMWFFSTHASRKYTDVGFEHGDAIIFGSESRGLPKELLAHHPDRVLRIAARPQVRSLNVSTALRSPAMKHCDSGADLLIRSVRCIGKNDFVL